MSFKIFIVDDDPAMLEMIKDFILEKYGDTELFTFSTGEAALLELNRRPDVIVLDYHLDSYDSKSMNGIEILRRIKALLPDTPVIFISGNDHPEVAANTIKFGAYDYISKNENAFHRLEIMINNATGHFSLQKELRIQRVFNWILLVVLIAVLASLLFLRFYQV